MISGIQKCRLENRPNARAGIPWCQRIVVQKLAELTTQQSICITEGMVDTKPSAGAGNGRKALERTPVGWRCEFWRGGGGQRDRWPRREPAKPRSRKARTAEGRQKPRRLRHCALSADVSLDLRSGSRSSRRRSRRLPRSSCSKPKSQSRQLPLSVGSPSRGRSRCSVGRIYPRGALA